MSSYKWSESAATDLQRIAEFIREFNPELEQRIIGAIIERATILRRFPRLGTRREVDENGTELRTLLAGSRYRLIYQVTVANEVVILQVLDVRSEPR